MKKRIISVCVFLSITAVFMLLGRFTRLAFAVICAAICCHDLCHALSTGSDRHVTPWTGWCFIAVSAVLIWFDFPVSPMLVAIVFTFCALGVSVFTPHFRPSEMLLSLGVCVYPVSLVMTIGYILCLDGPYWYVTALTGAASAAICDTFALFGGMRFGKHRLAPRVSPKKTVEGSVCGLLSAVVTGVILYFAFSKTGVEIPLWGYIVVCAVSSTLGQMGDLIASSFKREAGIKDYSNLIPGHGGMLDRLDSHMFAIPAAYFMMVVLGHIA